MNEDDHIALRDIIKAQLRETGLADIADDQNYLVEDDGAEAGAYTSAYLPTPKKHLIALLEAFRRHLAVQDGRLARASIAMIDEAVENKGPETFVAEPQVRWSEEADEVTDDGQGVDLGSLRDRGELIVEIDRLIASVQNPGEEPEQ